jgi:uridine phosphorylase
VSGPIHLQPTAQLADRVLLPGDPGRALRLAQALVREPKMFNHHRGLWGYTGPAADGELLTIQSTGMGGPSAAIVISEIAELGAQRLVRVGTCGGLVAGLALGDLVLAQTAIAQDGTSRALAVQSPLHGDLGLTAALREGGEAKPLTVVSTDLFYGTSPQDQQGWLAAGADAVEMETATLFALAARHGLQAASLLIVSDLLFGDRVRIDEADLLEAELRMGALALRALARESSEPAGSARSRSARASPR